MSKWCRSALCGHPLPALTDNWTYDAASRHTIAPISHTRPSPVAVATTHFLSQWGQEAELPWAHSRLATCSRLLAVGRVWVKPTTSRLWVRYSTTKPLHPQPVIRALEAEDSKILQFWIRSSWPGDVNAIYLPLESLTTPPVKWYISKHWSSSVHRHIQWRSALGIAPEFLQWSTYQSLERSQERSFIRCTQMSLVLPPMYYHEGINDDDVYDDDDDGWMDWWMDDDDDDSSPSKEANLNHSTVTAE